MPIYMNRSEWDRLSEQEKSLRLAEGVILRDDDWQEQQARRERAQAELAEWRAEHEPKPLKRQDWERLPEAERNAHIKAGGVLVD
jgi:hypothetical protein